MGQIKVTKNVGGIEGLCIIEPAVHEMNGAISWKPITREIWRKQDSILTLYRITRA